MPSQNSICSVLLACKMAYQQTSDVNDSYFTSNVAIGGPGGSEFLCGVGPDPPQSGTVVRSLKVWYYKGSGITALEVGLSNGRFKSFGIKTHNATASEKFVIAPGEKISSLKLWPSTYQGGRCGGFEVITNQNRTFSIDAWKCNPLYQPEIGSGLLVGMYGRVCADIDSLGFAILRRVASAQLIEVQYPDHSILQVATQLKQIKSITYDNSEGTTEKEFTVEGCVTMTTAESWSVTAGMESSIEAKVQARIPEISEAREKAAVTLSVSGTYDRSNTRTIERSYAFPVKVPAGQRLQATATLYEGNIKTGYKGKMLYTLASGATFGYDVSGEYNGISASQVAVTLVPVESKHYSSEDTSWWGRQKSKKPQTLQYIIHVKNFFPIIVSVHKVFS